MDEPTRGIDVGAKQGIYALMEELAARGVAIPVCFQRDGRGAGMSDRGGWWVHEGRIAGELDREVLAGGGGKRR
ncbi:MAG: hypothetical protein Ct9H300mP1_23560 [Planctomycetaceae bacterium]|nr:MAG: hypothetical protein Ct9H300mP1_23560 [Planctomycetaceae bacterium]